jgi:hypothetical protein
VYYIYNTLSEKERDMNFISTIQPRDWMIAIAAFVAGAWIF